MKILSYNVLTVLPFDIWIFFNHPNSSLLLYLSMMEACGLVLLVAFDALLCGVLVLNYIIRLLEVIVVMYSRIHMTSHSQMTS